MDLTLDLAIAKFYKNNPQRIRVITEHWTKDNAYCSYCGQQIIHFTNNRPVADFYCNNDHEEFELKSKANKISMKIMAGQYDKMITRILSDDNPNLFLLSYLQDRVNNFCVIPKYLLTPGIIQKRKPLASTAKRAHWVGCNILISHIPEIGKVYYVRDGQINKKQNVLEQFGRIAFLKSSDIVSKGWILDTMKCIDKINNDEFSLQDVYDFAGELSKLHPENHNIKPKIRQQLQILRDRELVKFLGNGKYRKV